jgi:abnormal spindle-like microcephaly-associated protein
MIQRRHAAAAKIQSAWREYAARQKQIRDQVAAEERNRLMEIEHRERAATRIQSAWRGYRVRKEVFRLNKEMEEVKRRFSEVRHANPRLTLGARTESALDALLHYKSLQKLCDHLKSLETSTRMSPECCKTIATPAAIAALLTILKQCNRSEPVKEVTSQAMVVLINLAKYDETRSALKETPNFMDDIIERAKIFISSDAIVTRILTIVWILMSKDKIRLKVSSLYHHRFYVC